MKRYQLQLLHRATFNCHGPERKGKGGLIEDILKNHPSSKENRGERDTRKWDLDRYKRVKLALEWKGREKTPIVDFYNKYYNLVDRSNKHLYKLFYFPDHHHWQKLFFVILFLMMMNAWSCSVEAKFQHVFWVMFLSAPNVNVLANGLEYSGENPNKNETEYKHSARTVHIRTRTGLVPLVHLLCAVKFLHLWKRRLMPPKTCGPSTGNTGIWSA